MRIKQIKRIIAREGLVLLIVLVVSGALLWVHDLIPYNDSDSSYVYFCSMGGKKYTIELRDDADLLSAQQGEKIFTALRQKYPKDFLVVQEAQHRIPHDFRIEYVKVKFSLPGQIKNTAFNLSLCLLLIAYPVYLIFHFISWAIRLLMEE